MLFHFVPSLSSLKTFGCACFPLLKPYTNHKLQPKSTQCIFLGCPPLSKGYICFDPDTYKVYITPHVIFSESKFPTLPTGPFDSSCTSSYAHPPLDLWISTLLSSSSDSSFSGVADAFPSVLSSFLVSSQSSNFPATTIDVSLPSSSLISSSSPIASSSPAIAEFPDHLPSSIIPSSSSLPNSHPMLTKSKHGIFKPKAYVVVRNYLQEEPPTFNIASRFPHWVEVIDFEYNSLLKQQTWSLVPLPSSKNVVHCKWVYKIKRGNDGSIARYKARLVAKGFLQQYGLDYEETFSLVVKLATVRIILALAVQFNWSLKQLDVSNAFLHGVLQEEVFMSQPPGYIDPDHPNHVCKLHKAIYGLKQAPRAWFDSFTSQLFHLGFQASSVDCNLFILHQGSFVVYLLLYVDDIMITGNSVPFIEHLVSRLDAVFYLKDLGPLAYFLGLQIKYTLQAYLYISPSMPWIFLPSLICWTISLASLPTLLQFMSALNLALCYMILQFLEAWLVGYNI